MQEDTDYYSFHDYPVFLQKTEILLDWIKELSFSDNLLLSYHLIQGPGAHPGRQRRFFCLTAFCRVFE